MGTYSQEKEIGPSARFAFGKNWAKYITGLNDHHIQEAKRSLTQLLNAESLAGRRFLDVGCGSGLFSLAARQLGAKVHSFDYDLDSVWCTNELRRRYGHDSQDWIVEHASILDTSYLMKLQPFDVVYSWGVLHHTGAMWKALEHVSCLVKFGGVLVIAIYNDQGRASLHWLQVKRLYNRLPRWLRGFVLWPAFIRLWGPTMTRDLLSGEPLKTWRSYGDADRGMSPWRDVVDWVGGYPFEVAKPEAIFDYFSARQFVLKKMKTCGGGHGCNEFVFERRAEVGPRSNVLPPGP